MHLTLAKVYRETSRYDLEVETYRAVLRKGKEYKIDEPNVRNMLGLAFQNRLRVCQDDSARERIIRNVSASFPGTVDISSPEYSKLFRVSERVVVSSCADAHRNDLQRALNEYETCIKLNPRHFEAIVNRGTLYRSSGHADLAAQSYEQALEQKPAQGMLLHNLAEVALDRKLHREALAYSHRAYEADGAHDDRIVTGHQRTLESVGEWLEEHVEGEHVVRRPIEALGLYKRIFDVGPAEPRILARIVDAFSTLKSLEDRQQHAQMLSNVHSAVASMSLKDAREVMTNQRLASLVARLQSVGRNFEAEQAQSILRNNDN